jgi:hypothetical protein
MRIQKIVTSVKEPKKNPKKTKQCHEIDANQSKDRAMHEGDHSLF